MVYALVKENENYIFKAYFGKIGEKLLLLNESIVYLKEVESEIIISSGQDKVTIRKRSYRYNK